MKREKVHFSRQSKYVSQKSKTTRRATGVHKGKSQTREIRLRKSKKKNSFTEFCYVYYNCSSVSLCMCALVNGCLRRRAVRAV